jgi:hypothetical protein
MKPKAKKLKLSEEKVSLDPLERIHLDLHDFIFQHFKGKEVKKVSEVATNWYLNLGSSQVAMSKIQLSLASITKKSDEALFTSQRRYSNFVFVCAQKATAVRRFNILKAFADSLEHLEIKQVTNDFHKTVSDFNSVEFPKLKSLKLAKNDGYTRSQLKLFQMLLDKRNKEEFRKIHLTHYTPELLKMVLKMPKLKYLAVAHSWKCSIENLELPVNESVTAAVFDGFNQNMKRLINCLPNLEEVEIGYISEDKLKIFGENSPKLKKLFYANSFITNIKKTSNELKLANPLINENIELIQKPQGFNLMHQN